MATLTIRELPVDTGDHIHFTISQTPDQQGDGSYAATLTRGSGTIRQTPPFPAPADFSISGTTITLVLPLVAPDWLYIEYQYTASPGPTPPTPTPPGATSLGDLIFEAYVMAGLADPRDGTVAPEDAAYGYRKINDLIDLLGTHRLTMYREQRVGPFTVTAGMGDVTTTPPSPIKIGPGATWDTARPMFIDRAGIIYTAGGVPQPELAVHSFTTQEWARITVKGITATLSRSFFFDRDYDSNGWADLYLYPVPSASFKMVLYVPDALTQMPDDGHGNPVFSTPIIMPPGYRAMLISNLAVIISLGLIDIPASVADMARDTLASIKVANAITHWDALSCDEAVLGRDGRTSGWDWLTGEIN